MARLPTIAARAPPRRKTSSSSSHRAASSTGATQTVQVTKAAKRSAKRDKLLSAPSGDVATAHPRPIDALGIPPTISKSALRRRKRKARDEAVLGKGGLEGIKDELDDLVEPEEEPGVEDQVVAVHEKRPLSPLTRQASAKVGNRLRKRVLAQESMRQPYLLKDLYATHHAGQHASPSAPLPSPFAAIRRHAHNSLGLPNSSTSGASSDVDQVMK